MSTKPSKLFISHAAADAPIVEEFADLLELGIGIQMDDIFCTSRKGQSIPAGLDFKEAIRSRLDSATTVLALISPNFYASPFCMCELGASWVLARGNFIPILIPPASFQEMKAVLVGLQALKLDKTGDLDELKDDLTERLNIAPRRTARWSEKRDKFLEQLAKLLSPAPSTSQPTHVPLPFNAEHLAQTPSDRDNNATSQVIPPEVVMQHGERMEALLAHNNALHIQVANARKTLSKLLPITQEAFCWRYTSGSKLDLTSESHSYGYDDALVAQQYSQVFIGNGTAELNLKNTKTRRADTALSELSQWLDEAPPWFRTNYEEQHDHDLSLENREFWDQRLRPNSEDDENGQPF